jgi:flap endonuclease-1
MGVKGLSKFLAKYSKQISFIDLKGKKIAIDTSIFLYKFKYNTVNNDFLTRFYYQVQNFKKHSITPVYIFDGECPPEKKETQVKRQEQREKNSEQNRIYITKDDILNLKKLLKHLNVDYMCPNTEGEKYCSYLNKTDPNIYGVMSNDFDSLAYGCKKLITFQSELKEYNLEEILTDLNITLDTFIDICIASGTDYYQQGIPRMGVSTGLKKIKIEPDICKWKGVPEDLNIPRIREIFKCDPNICLNESVEESVEEDLSSFIKKLNLKITLKNSF